MIYRDKRQLLTAMIRRGDSVLDIGFLGENISREGVPNWAHDIIKSLSDDVYGLDMALPDAYRADARYAEGNAETFTIGKKFDVIFAGDIIEHLSNPGLFLERCRMHLKEGGKLVITTPNAFNLFNIAEKFTKYEPTSNHDHTCYYNLKTLRQLLNKNGMRTVDTGYVYHLGFTHRESWKKRVLNAVYYVLSKCTDKFVETLVVVAQPL